MPLDFWIVLGGLLYVLVSLVLVALWLERRF